ncbi:putative membrane protein [Waddlia chondrophila 2032/99]|uniref:Putative membrane protein n=2 Tax=Waddlia chondrophila TaxID=71667 RepID=D6YUW2_WADCW|nr:hypothetical protein [Waddlia chondrophila]ADI37923.1 putative membrane protein [Waddlia chondrophila WSU 86-1044]CCB91300.1 putative membrane protein [Waddlia chondrophila 2032/99]
MSTNLEGHSPFAPYLPYIIPPVSAGASIIPVFRGFIIKSAQQLGKPAPRMTVFRGLWEGLRASPTIGAVIGAQLVIQEIAEKKLFTPPIEGQQPSLLSMLVSSAFVGTLSAPGLAVFNGQSMGKSLMQSLKGLSLLQTAAIVARETCFLLSIRISDPVSNHMKNKFGDHPSVIYGSTFFSAAFGSLISHPADTALTCWQKGIQVNNLSHAMKGGPVKALAVGSFAVAYKITKEALTILLSTQK